MKENAKHKAEMLALVDEITSHTNEDYCIDIEDVRKIKQRIENDE